MILRPRCDKKCAISDGFVVTGNGTSSTDEIIASSDLFTVSSEQTHRYDQDTFECWDHSNKVWDKRLKDGTKTSVECESRLSIIHIAVKVFPVPQAIINWPREAFLKPSVTSWIASDWCVRGPHFEIVLGPPSDKKVDGQNSCNESKYENITWVTWLSCNMRRAFADNPSVDATNILRPYLRGDAAEINESNSDLGISRSESKHFAWTATSDPSFNSATRSIPTSGPGRSGHSSHNHTFLTSREWMGSFWSHHLTIFSNCFPRRWGSESNDLINPSKVPAATKLMVCDRCCNYSSHNCYTKLA